MPRLYLLLLGCCVLPRPVPMPPRDADALWQGCWPGPQGACCHHPGCCSQIQHSSLKRVINTVEGGKRAGYCGQNPGPDPRFSQDRASTKLCSESNKVGLVIEGWWQDMRCSFVNTQSITSTQKCVVVIFFLVQTLHLILTRSFHTRAPPSLHTRGLPTDK